MSGHLGRHPYRPLPPTTISLHFLYGWRRSSGKKACTQTKRHQERERFWEVLCTFNQIAEKLSLTDEDLKNDWTKYTVQHPNR